MRKGFEQESAATRKPTLLLTAAVPAGKSYIDGGYDIPLIMRYVYFHRPRSEAKVMFSQAFDCPSPEGGGGGEEVTMELCHHPLLRDLVTSPCPPPPNLGLGPPTPPPRDLVTTPSPPGTWSPPPAPLPTWDLVTNPPPPHLGLGHHHPVPPIRFSLTNYTTWHHQSINVIIAHDLYWKGLDTFRQLSRLTWCHLVL